MLRELGLYSFSRDRKQIFPVNIILFLSHYLISSWAVGARERMCDEWHGVNGALPPSINASTCHTCQATGNTEVYVPNVAYADTSQQVSLSQQRNAAFVKPKGTRLLTILASIHGIGKN
jgi:hypothetical protein